MGKKKGFNKKPKRSVLEIVPKDAEPEPLPAVRNSDDPIPKKERWINKQRCLVFAARGINHRDRHLMKDIRTLMPHHRAESKMERSKTLSVINEMCEMKHCNKAMLFEGRRKRDLYMWIANTPDGPSAKFLVENIHTLAELKMTGNCLRGARPLLSFDSQFDGEPHLALLKEMLTQTFGVPNHHPKSQPFVDHVFTFSYIDNRIWFRNFQILSEDGGLAEVGPRFVMNPVKIFDGSFCGDPIWENPDYVSPAKHRQSLKTLAKDRYVSKLNQKVNKTATEPQHAYKFNKLDGVFASDVGRKAKQLSRQAEYKASQPKAKDVDENEVIVKRKEKIEKTLMGKAKKAIKEQKEGVSKKSLTIKKKKGKKV